MLSFVTSISSLLLGVAILLMGTGLLSTLLALRAGLEHFSTPATGLIMSAYFFGYILGTFTVPRVIASVGHIRAFSAMASIASIAVLSHALFVQPVVWGLLRMITGVCIVGLYMVVESWLNGLAPNSARGRMFAIYQIISLSALAVAQFLILVGDVVGFVPFAIASVLFSLALVPVALTQVAQPTPIVSPRLGLGHVYRASPLGVVGSTASGMLNGAFWGMGPVFVSLAGFSRPWVAAFMCSAILGGATLQWPVGRLSDRYDRRKVLIGVSACAALSAVGLYVSAGHDPRLLVVTAILYGGLVFTVYPLAVAHTHDFVGPAGAVEASRALLVAHGVGAMLGPFLAGLMMGTLGPAALMVYFAVVLAAVAVFGVFRLLVRPTPEVEVHAGFVPMLRTSQAALEMDPRSEPEGGGGER